MTKLRCLCDECLCGDHGCCAVGGCDCLYCDDCHGLGYVKLYQGINEIIVKCEECNGRGYFYGS